MKILYFIDNAMELAVQGAETVSASALTVARRGIMAGSQPLARRTWAESQRMVNEKFLVGMQVSAQMQKSALECAAGSINPFQAWLQVLAPVRDTALANARRLSK